MIKDKSNKFSPNTFNKRWQVFLKPAMFFDWVRHKRKQFTFLIHDENIARALTSPIKEPIEGARFQIGDLIHARTDQGKCRHFQVCGIQSGGFSNVYFVIDKNKMQAYCLKGNRALSKDEKIQDEDLRKEALIWLKLGNHPNIVSALAAFSINDRMHILIEHIAGESLSSLRKSGCLDLPTTLKYAIHLCRAMIHAQKALPGFVHGDIKPGNCLVTKEGILKLTDFGLAFSIYKTNDCISNDLNSKQHGVSGEISSSLEKRGGTNAYMAPEKFNSGQSVTALTDIYAFGITLFELLAGKRPFRGPTRDDYREQHKLHDPPVELLKKKAVPPDIIDLILECLAKSPVDRIHSFKSIEKELTKIYSTLTGNKVSPCFEIPLTISDKVNHAIAFAELGDVEKSESYFKQALAINPRSAEVWSQWALTKISTDNPNQADTYSAKAVGLNPRSPKVLLARAKVLSVLGNKNEALFLLDKVLEKNSENFSALNLKGEILFYLKRHREAIDCFKKALVLDDFHAEPSNLLAKVYISTKKFEEALYYAKKAYVINHNNAEITKTLGDSYYHLKLYEKAIEFYKKSIEMGIDRKVIRRVFVKACCKFYKSEGGIVTRRLIEILWRSASSPENLNPRFAKDIYQLLSAENYNPLLLYFLDDFIFLSLRRANKKLKEDFFENLWKSFNMSDYPFMQFNPYYSIGKLFYLNERFDDCLKVFRHSLKENKQDDEKAFYYLGACYEIKGRLNLSFQYYRKALELNKTCELNLTGKRRIEMRLRELEKS